jgi:hypothetical protein
VKILRERINIDLINKNNSIEVDPKAVIVVEEVKKIIKIINKTNRNNLRRTKTMGIN